MIGIKDRKFIDHTATHLHRGIGDIMRYAALVTSAEASEFGPHQMMGKNTKTTGLRVSDGALYALAFYLYSLKPASLDVVPISVGHRPSLALLTQRAPAITKFLH